MVGFGVVEIVGVIGVAGSLALAVVLIKKRGDGKWRPERWAEQMGVSLTSRNQVLIGSYIRRTRAFRIGGGVVGFAGPIVASAYRGGPLPEPFANSLLTALAGYLIGAVLAELTFKRPRPATPSAALEPRELRQYLPAGMSRTLRLVGAAVVLSVPIYLLVPARHPRAGSEQLIAWVVLPIAIAITVELLQRYIVRRPQPLDGEDLVAADDAIRSASVHALAGAGIGLELLSLATTLAAIGFVTDIQLLRWTLPFVGIICMGAAIGSWIDLTRPDRWRVNRSAFQTQP